MYFSDAQLTHSNLTLHDVDVHVTQTSTELPYQISTQKITFLPFGSSLVLTLPGETHVETLLNWRLLLFALELHRNGAITRQAPRMRLLSCPPSNSWAFCSFVAGCTSPCRKHDQLYPLSHLSSPLTYLASYHFEYVRMWQVSMHVHRCVGAHTWGQRLKVDVWCFLQSVCILHTETKSLAEPGVQIISWQSGM